MFLKQLDLTTALRPAYLPDEVLLFVQDNVGLYEGLVDASMCRPPLACAAQPLMPIRLLLSPSLSSMMLLPFTVVAWWDVEANRRTSLQEVQATEPPEWPGLLDVASHLLCR